MVFLPVKALGPLELVHEGKSKLLKYCRPEFDGALFYDMKHFISDMKDIYFFIYKVLGRETFI